MNIGFSTLFTSVGIVKVLFKLMQKVVLKENFKTFNVSLVFNDHFMYRLVQVKLLGDLGA